MRVSTAEVRFKTGWTSDQIECARRHLGVDLREAVELPALDALVDAFAAEMKAKLRRQVVDKGYAGWDDPDWHPDDIKLRLYDHVAKGDMVDVANLAAFLWNKEL